MRIRTLLYIVLFLVVVYAVAALYDDNREVLNQEIRLWGDVRLRVSLSLFVFLVIGAGATLVAGITREFGLMVERRRLRKASRKAEEIEEEYSRGLVAVLEGREDEALDHFRAVLERDSRHYNTLLKVGDVLRHQERFDEAIEYHKKAHHLKEEDTQALYALIDDYEARGDLDRARVVVGTILSLTKNSVSVWRKLRSLHVKQRNWVKALEAHERVEKLAPRDDARSRSDRQYGRGIRYEMAVERLRDDRPKEAIAALKKLIKEDATFIPAHLRLGEALNRSGQERDAVETWYRGFESTGSPVFLTTLEEHYLQREQPLAAIEALKRCVASTRKDTLPRFYLGKLYFRLEMLDDAQTVLASLEGRASYAPTLHYLLGRIHERRANHREAALEYRKVIKEMELVQLEYRCAACRDTLVEWMDRCPSCGEWNTVEVDFREEISLEELGISAAPIYSSRLER